MKKAEGAAKLGERDRVWSRSLVPVVIEARKGEMHGKRKILVAYHHALHNQVQRPLVEYFEFRDD